MKPSVPKMGDAGEAYIIGVLGKKPGTDYKPGCGPLRADGTQASDTWV